MSWREFWDADDAEGGLVRFLVAFVVFLMLLGSLLALPVIVAAAMGTLP